MTGKSLYYTLKDIARLTGKSSNLLLRRLNEEPKKYEIRFARKQGWQWTFRRELVDEAIKNDERLIVKLRDQNKLDDDKIKELYLSRS